jgi:hypothetical protein
MPRVPTALTVSVPMIGRGLGVHVVVAYDVALDEATGADGADGGDGDRAGAVVLGSNGFHGGEDVEAGLSIGLAFFIAHGPHEDAGVIAVTADEIGELGEAFGV